MKVHEFHTETSEEVYDRTQCDESISNGDVLVLHAEGIIGILDEAWPVALTKEHGEFHRIEPPYENYYLQTFPDALFKAAKIATQKGWEHVVPPPF